MLTVANMWLAKLSEIKFKNYLDNYYSYKSIPFFKNVTLCFVQTAIHFKMKIIIEIEFMIICRWRRRS